MTERAACALQQRVQTTGCFLLVSKAAKRLVKAVPTFFPGLFPGVNFCRAAGAGQARRGWREAALCSSATDASWRGACSSRGNVVGFLGPHLLPLLLFSQVFHRLSSVF